MAINDVKLKFWIDNNYNVLFAGEHGVGKTSIVKKAFDDAGLNWLYFSAATLDPWVDFVGVPKEVTDKDGTKYIDLVRPKHFAYDQVEAIFLDELNRSHKKVRNAVMELLQFKSINGKRFNNLRIIWAAINPDEVPEEEDEYDVEKLDPAQKDRFEVQVNIPYKPDLGYFTKRYGKSTAEVGVEWWNQLDRKARKTVSPRRLDYALGMHERGGDLRDILGDKVNIQKLVVQLTRGSFESNMVKIFESGDKQKAREFIRDRNNFDGCKEKLVKKEKYIAFFNPGITDEDKILLMAKYKLYYDYIISNLDDYHNLLHDFYLANSGMSNENNESKERKEKKSLLNKLGQDSIRNLRVFDAIHGSYKPEAEISKLEDSKKNALDLSMTNFSESLLEAFNNVDDYKQPDAYTNIIKFTEIGVFLNDKKKHERWLNRYNIVGKKCQVNNTTQNDNLIVTLRGFNDDMTKNSCNIETQSAMKRFCRKFLHNTTNRVSFMKQINDLTPYNVDINTLRTLTFFVRFCIESSQLKTIMSNINIFSSTLSYLVNQISYMTKKDPIHVLRQIFLVKTVRNKVSYIIAGEAYKDYCSVSTSEKLRVPAGV